MKIGKIVEVIGTKVKAIIYEKMPPHIITNTDIVSHNYMPNCRRIFKIR